MCGSTPGQVALGWSWAWVREQCSSVVSPSSASLSSCLKFPQWLTITCELKLTFSPLSCFCYGICHSNRVKLDHTSNLSLQWDHLHHSNWQTGLLCFQRVNFNPAQPRKCLPRNELTSFVDVFDMAWFRCRRLALFRQYGVLELWGGGRSALLKQPLRSRTVKMSLG